MEHPTNQPAAFEGFRADADSYYEDAALRESLNLLVANRLAIVGITVACLALGILYLAVARPTFEAAGLVQVEESKGGGVGAAVSELNSLLMGGSVQTEAEMQILQSRMILDQVIDKMNLLIEVKPRQFPLIGGAIAKFGKNRQPSASPPLFFPSFARGGERIAVSTFDVPEESVNKRFKLLATAGGYTLLDVSGNKVLDGKIGELASAESPNGQIQIFVKDLVASPGTAFYVTHKSRADVVAALQEALKVGEQGKQSGVISISFHGGSPDGVATTINNIEDAYLRQNVERHSAEAQQSLEYLSKQLPDLRLKVENAQASLNAYQQQHGTVDVTRETEQVLNSNVDLEMKRLELQQQREEMMQRFTSQHPVIKSLDDQLKLVQESLDKAKQGIHKLPSTQQDVFSLLRDVDVATSLYTQLLDTIQQLQVAKAGTVGNVRIVDRALKPERAASPKPPVVVLVSLVMGLFLGGGFVFGRRALLRGIDDPMEVERRFGLVTFASIPYSPLQRRLTSQMVRGRSKNFLLASSNEDPLVAEALRSLRIALHFALAEAPNNVLMLTGPSPGLGKSFVATNLAAAMAQAGKKVVLVDADLRRGHVNRYFTAEAAPGITDFIVGDADQAAIVRSTAIAGMEYIARGTLPPNPAELLLTDKFTALIQDLSARYDHVIVDSPPVLPVADASIIGRLAGCILLVLKSAEHPAREIEDTIKRLSNARLSARGMIFNQVGAKVGSYGYGNYGYTYSEYK